MLAGATKQNAPHSLIDFSIRVASIPVVSYVDVLNGDPSALRQLKDKKVIAAAPHSSLATASACQTAAWCPDQCCRRLADELDPADRRSANYALADCWIGLLAPLVAHRCAATALLDGAVGRPPCGAAVAMIDRTGQSSKPNALILNTLPFQAASHSIAGGRPAEIEPPRALTHAAERRFRNIAMGIGDGLVCMGTKPG